MLDMFADGETPMISLASSVRIIEPVDAKRAWSFKTPQTDVMMAGAILEHAAAARREDAGLRRLLRRARRERSSPRSKGGAGAQAFRSSPTSASRRKDTSVVGQALKLIAAKPDADRHRRSGTPAALPATTLTERGYKGRLYFNHGVANNDFLRVGGKDVEGAYVPASPVIVASQLPDSHPAKTAGDAIHEAATRRRRAQAAFGVRLLHVGRLPRADERDSRRAEAAQPGTPNSARALRDALEATKTRR